MANRIAGSGAYRHEVPTELNRVVSMHDANSNGGDIYLTANGTFRLIDLCDGEGACYTGPRCVLLRLRDVDLDRDELPGFCLYDLDTPDGLAFVVCDFDAAFPGEILWDSTADTGGAY